MLYVENLSEFVKLMIDHEESGVFFPQNKEYTNTTEMVKQIASLHGKRLWITSVFNWGLYLIRPFVNLVDKAFGSLTYDQSISEYPKGDYRKISLKESIIRTERYL